MVHERIVLDKFTESFSTFIELSSVALGGRIVSVSDEFFAEAHHLLLVEPAPSLKGQFGPKGALFSGWETRRHNPSHDWCIIKLGCPGAIFGFDIDTAHFNGNEAPQVSVDGLFTGDPSDVLTSDSRWSELVPRVNLGPNSRHLFRIPESGVINYVRLNMYPDGGIARFRVYGLVSPVFPQALNESFDLAHVFAGGRVVFTSDQHFGVGSNLILPGRGKDMADGWETKRSRVKGHKDWAIVKLGTPGFLSQVQIDTANFMGNFPESCELHALHSLETLPATNEEHWALVLPRTKLGPHRRHYFQLENVDARPYTHIRVTIHPDGGIKRVRVIGVRAPGDAVVGVHHATAPLETPSKPVAPPLEVPPVLRTSPVGSSLALLPLTAEAFAAFGQVIQAWSDPLSAPRGTKYTYANQGSATKFHKLAPIVSSYPAGMGATTALSVFRCSPLGAAPGELWPIRILERHPYTTQAFVPMGGAVTSKGWGADDALQLPGHAYLVIVARNGEDDRPDTNTMRAFVANAGQGIMYSEGIWHHPMAVLERTMDFTCVETQIGNGDKADCEVVELDGSSGLHTVKIPSF